MNVKRTTSFLLCTALVAVAGQSFARLQKMGDEEMSAITGQALFVSDHIPANTGDGNPYNDFDFYRVGLDVLLELNLNIDKLQLGCGGVNDALDSSVCDIDMDFVRFMGSGAGQTSPDGFPIDGVASAANAPESRFKLLRPYLEIAIRNDGSKTQREIVGIKIGSETVDGYIGAGRFNSTNNHVGINAVSGFLDTIISGYLRFDTDLGGGAGCIGDPDGHPECDGIANYQAPVARTTGTRMRRLQTPDLPIQNLHGSSGLISLFNGQDLYGNLDVDLDYLHGFRLNNTGDFFLSMQRERVAYPTFDKSGYSVTANTGWWMNVPRVELLNLEPPTQDLGCPGGFLCLGMFDAFGSPGLAVSNPDLGSRPPQNCYGNTLFC